MYTSDDTDDIYCTPPVHQIRAFNSVLAFGTSTTIVQFSIFRNDFIIFTLNTSIYLHKIPHMTHHFNLKSTYYPLIYSLNVGPVLYSLALIKIIETSTTKTMHDFGGRREYIENTKKSLMVIKHFSMK